MFRSICRTLLLHPSFLRSGFSVDGKKGIEMMTDDVLTSREERCFRLWINNLGIGSFVNNVFEDVKSGWILLEVLDKVSPKSVNWKCASKPWFSNQGMKQLCFF